VAIAARRIAPQMTVMGNRTRLGQTRSEQ